MPDYPLLVYLGAVLVFIVGLIRRAEHKVPVLLILVWLLGYPVFGRPELYPRVETFGFDIQPNRALLILLTPLFLFKIYGRETWLRRTDRRSGIGFEEAMLLYVGVAIIAIMSNAGTIGSVGRAIAFATNFLLFVIAYFVSKWYCSPEDFKVISTAIVALALFSTFVGTIQFFLNPDFFRMGGYRIAFGDYVRTNGVFSEEYDQAFFQIIALLIGFRISHKWYWSLFLLIVCSVSVFLTMHRLSALVLIVILALYGAIAVRHKSRLLITTIILGVVGIVAIWLAPWEEIVPQDSLEAFYTRVTENTLSTRMDYNLFGIRLMLKYPGGIGDFYTDLYSDEAYQVGLPFESLGFLNTRANIVHNGIIAAGVKYGIVGFMAFALFLLSLVAHFVKLLAEPHQRGVFPVLIAASYCLFNTTQDFSNLGTQMPVIFAIVLGCLVAQQVEQGAGMSRQRSAHGRLSAAALDICPTAGNVHS